MGMTTNLAGLATLGLMLGSPALATPLIANFDGFPEPTVAATISDGGISFSEEQNCSKRKSAIDQRDSF